MESFKSQIWKRTSMVHDKIDKVNNSVVVLFSKILLLLMQLRLLSRNGKNTSDVLYHFTHLCLHRIRHKFCKSAGFSNGVLQNIDKLFL